MWGKRELLAGSKLKINCMPSLYQNSLHPLKEEIYLVSEQLAEHMEDDASSISI